MGDAHPPEGSKQAAKAKAQPDGQKAIGASEKPAGSAKPADGAGAKPELSNAEKKKRAKEEKAARRAQEKGPAPSTANGTADAGQSSRGGAPQKKTQQSEEQQKPGGQPGPSRISGTPLPSRQRRPSHAADKEAPRKEATQPQLNKQVPFCSHLYASSHRRHTLEGAAKDVHPAILALALQMSNYVICGSQARCVAMLLALKTVIAGYTTPPSTSLPRHLSSNYLSPQLSHLKSHGRPFSTSQSAAIRWLKNTIATLDPSTDEPVAKAHIASAIDTFIRERFTVADAVIATTLATDWIRDGDTVLVYGHSAVVARALAHAARARTRFHILVADSRPLFEGRALARSLPASCSVAYTLLSSLTSALAAASSRTASSGRTICLLGAHSVLGTGAIQSRTGTALVALAARDAGATVIVATESVKFTERTALDSLASNELAPPEDLAADDAAAASLAASKTRGNLYLLNPMYDVTPARLVDVVVTELGTAPPGAAPAVLRLAGGEGGADAV